MMLRYYIFIFLIISTYSAVDLSVWELFDTNTTSLVVSANVMWKVNPIGPYDAGGYLLYKWNYATQAWAGTGFRGFKVALNTQYAWHVNALNKIFRAPIGTSSWVYISSFTVYELSVATTTVGWAIGTTAAASGGGYVVYKYNIAAGSAQTMANIGGVKIAATTDGNAWVVTNTGAIKKFDGTSWTTVSGAATNIIVGSDGIPYMTSTIATDGGYEIYKGNSDGSQWELVPGVGGTNVTLDQNNQPYVITNTTQVYRMRGGTSTFCPTCMMNCAPCATQTTETAACKACRTTLCWNNNQQCKTCLDGTYPLQSTSTCEPCSDKCAICSNANICLTCKPDFGLDSNKNCVVCQGGTYPSQTTGKCELCTGNCDTCTDATTCKTCKPLFGLDNNNNCVTCSGNTYLSQTTGKCETCPSGCATCTDDNTCKSCDSGFGLKNNLCIACTDGKFVNPSDSVCLDCPTNCGVCTSTSTCQTCKTNSYFDTGRCIVCPANCVTCTDGNTCKTCDSGFGLRNKLCISCTDGRFVNPSDGVCLDCPANCGVCTSTSTCQTCKTNSYFDNNNQCVACQDGTYPSQSTQTCSGCPTNCATCTDANTCQTCKQGYGLNNNNQCRVCPGGTYTSLTTAKCTNCPSNCATCTNENTCQTCKTGFTLQNKQCNTSPDGAVLDDTPSKKIVDVEEESSSGSLSIIIIIAIIIALTFIAIAACALLWSWLLARRAQSSRRVQKIHSKKIFPEQKSETSSSLKRTVLEA